MERIDEVYEFYNGGAEIGRLERGLGVVEFWRSKEIISRYLNGTYAIERFIRFQTAHFKIICIYTFKIHI